MPEIQTILLAVMAFALGSVPFSVILGRLLLHKDITRYGDGNPGAANVFRAGSPVVGFLAVLLDLGKGVPFLLLARFYFDYPPVILVITGLAAILGHAFSPILRFRGGKAVAVTFGTLVGMLEPAMLFPFTFSVVAAVLVLSNHSWVVLMGPAGTLVFMLVTHSPAWQILYITAVAAIFIYKHLDKLALPPGLRPRVLTILSSFGNRFR